MLDIDDLSKIGFGGYRIEDDNKDHEKSLHHAIDSGCTLIETASNYKGGRSERLIGKATESIDKEVFIISKSGYIHSNEQDEVIDFFEKKSLRDSLHKVRDDFYYSIAPEYLEKQLNKSILNLQRSQIDAYLLHNPEYLLQGPNAKSVEVMYESIKSAFVFLEEKVNSEVIRYYGISSNTLAIPENDHFLDFNEIVKIAKEVSASNHFRIIEFPFNLLEQEALINHWNGYNLIDRAHQENVLCLGNRPFNANSAEGPIRLATYRDEVALIKPDDKKAYYYLKNDIQKALDSHGYEGSIADFEVIQYLDKNWMNFKSHEQRDQVVNAHLLPFLNQVFDQVPDSYFHFISSSELFLMKNITIRSEDIRKRDSDLQSYDESKGLTQVLCEFYIDSGLDAVLVGMRSKKYVNQLKGLF